MLQGPTTGFGKNTIRFLICIAIAAFLLFANKGIAQQMEVYVHFSPDCWGNENSWMLVDDRNETVAKAPMGSYITNFPFPETKHILPVTVKYGECYSFIVTDSQGDGMAGSIWDSCSQNGDFAVISAEGDTISKMRNAQFGGVHSDHFCLKKGCTSPLAENYDPEATLNDGSCNMPAVMADFQFEKLQYNCEYVTYRFTNLSSGGTSFKWEFENGTPSFSTELNPVVSFPTGTRCHVKLTTQNEDEQHTINKQLDTFQPEPGTSVTLVIEPDCFGEDISWKLLDASDQVIREVNPGTYDNIYRTDFPVIEEPFCLANDCYTFTIEDEYGDGLNGGRFMQCDRNGNYYLKDGNNIRILEPENMAFGKKASHTFCIDQLFVWDGTNPDFWSDPNNMPGKDDDVYINAPGGTLTLENDITVNTLTIAPGTELKMSNSSRKIRLHGDLVNNGTLELNQGMIVVEGNKTQHIKGSQPATLSRLYLDSPDTLRLFTALNINGTVQLKQGVLDINEQELTLLANDTQQGVIAEIQDEASVVGDTITFETYYPAAPGAWRLICSPIQGATFEDWNDDFPTTGFPGSNYPNYPTPEARSSNILLYDETFSQGEEANLKIGFTSIENIQDQIDPTKGYFTYFVAAPTVLDVRGKFVQGDVRIPLTYTPSESDHTHDGWNLISNPYPCAINWDDLAAQHKIGIDNAIYAYDPENGQYSSYVGGVSIGNLSNRVEPGQAFWVKAIDENAEILFTEDVKTPEQGVHMPSVDLNTEALIRIRISKENFKDDCVIGFNSTATSEFDPHMDAYKFYPTENDLPSIAVTPEYQSLSMSITMLPVPEKDMIIPLELKTGDLTEMYISNLEIDSYDEDYCFILEDRELNRSIPFNKGQVYKFDMTPQTKSDRFLLHVQAPVNFEVVHSGCPEEGTTRIEAAGFGSAPWEFTWTNEMGEVIKTTKNATTPDVLENIDPGFYQLDVTNSQRTCNSATKIIEVSSRPEMAEIHVTPIITQCDFDQTGKLLIDLAEGVQWDLQLIDEQGSLVQERQAAERSCRFEGLSAQTYHLKAANNCGAQRVFPNLDLRDPFALTCSIDVDRNATTIQEGGVIRFTANSDNATRFNWKFGDGDTMDNSQLAQHAYNEAGTFLATLVAENEQCQNTSTISVEIALDAEGLKEKDSKPLNGAPQVQLSIQENTLSLISDIDQPCHISIFNMNGGLVYSASRSAEDIQNCQLNISDLATGMYYLHLTTEDALLFAETFFRN